jgi:hypothetical protein
VSPITTPRRYIMGVEDTNLKRQRARKLLVTTVRPRCNDPSYQRSALSTSKQHWPTDMCRATCLVCEHCFTITMFLALFARFDVWVWNENLITMLRSSARIGDYHITGGRGQGSLWRFHCRQKASGFLRSLKPLWKKLQSPLDRGLSLSRVGQDIVEFWTL